MKISKKHENQLLEWFRLLSDFRLKQVAQDSVNRHYAWLGWAALMEIEVRNSIRRPW